MRPVLLRLLLTGLLALALAGGPAHRGRAADPDLAAFLAADSDLAAFLAAGGRLGDICADHRGAAGHPGPDCAACLPPLVGTAPAGARPPLAARAPTGRLARRGARRAGPIRRRPPAGRPRAPPVRPPA